MDEENSVTKVTKLNIPRGESDEISVDLDTIENLTVLNEKGDEIRLGDIYSQKKTIFIFLRHILCYTCKDYVDDLVKIPDEMLNKAGVQLVLIGSNSHTTMAYFKEETKFRHHVYADPLRQTYKALGFTTQFGQTVMQTSSKHVKSGWLVGILKSTWRAMSVQDFDGTMSQNGGSLIVGPGSTVHFSHIDPNMYAHCPINTLLSQIGADRINFPGDQMVEDI